MTRSRSDLAKILEEGSIPEPNSGCLLWLGRGSGHFGHCEFGHGKLGEGRWLAHRAAWVAAHGEIPAKMCVCHKCDVPACVNPAHLFLGTRADNCRDRGRKGRTVARRGESHPRTKLTEAIVVAIRADGRTRIAVGAEYGVSPRVVSDVVRRRCWRHV